ncbi:MAG: hypothetical protein RLY56_1679, partial [Pseudomonadota bacterium]
MSRFTRYTSRDLPPPDLESEDEMLDERP